MMTPSGLVLLLTWLPSEEHDEFSVWCDDHHREMLTVPGFLRARRFARMDGDGTDAQVLTMYETTDSSVLSSDAYIEHGRNSTGLPEFLGLRIVAMEPGRLTAEMAVDPKLLTGFGNMHGGVLSAACDHVLGCVCYPHMEKGQWAATTEFKINLLAPARGPLLHFEGQVTKAGRTISVVDGQAFQFEPGSAERKLVASMTATIMTVTGRDDVRG